MDMMPGGISDVKLFRVPRFGDERGVFSETFQAKRARDAGVESDFVQDNYSHSTKRGTLRGLHFQSPPFAQAKLVTVLKGSIFDVAVDLRRSSPTYGHHVGVELSVDNGHQILVPRGFAHGFVTLEDDTHVIYKVDAVYAPEHDLGVIWNDPDLAIDWPVAPEEVILSPKDQKQPRFANLEKYFD